MLGQHATIQVQRRGKLDRSYKLKLEKSLSEKKLNQQLLINCLAKFDSRASKLAVTMKQYKYNTMDCFNLGTKEELQKLIETLCKEYFLSLEQIKSEIASTLQDTKRSKNIPDYKTIDVVREIIANDDYVIV